MSINALAKRVLSLPPRYLAILACMAEGMSNHQIASALGYKTHYTVATLISGINKRLGLQNVFSRIEKRHLAANAFRRSNAGLVRMKLSPKAEGIGTNTLTLSSRDAGRLTSLLRQGYEIEAVEIVLRPAFPKATAGGRRQAVTEGR